MIIFSPFIFVPPRDLAPHQVGDDPGMAGLFLFALLIALVIYMLVSLFDQ